jgi:hypothetical protein
MGQQSKVGRHRTTVRSKKAGYVSVVYQNTEVVHVTPNTITLDSGGWFTSTTKTRMNQASNEYGLGYYVFQKDYKWYVVYKKKTMPFKRNKITFRR